MLSEKILAEVDQFINHEQQFHLGFLPTEQSSPLSRHLDTDFQESVEKGIRTLQRVDRNVLEMARRIFAGKEYRRLVDQGEKTIREGGRIIFSGCGATGRLSILLESMWKKACHDYKTASSLGLQVESIMTGGDYALVKSVEFFEDYGIFGRRQVCEAGMTAKDMLVAITEGGETSSVLGTVAEALDRGAAVFLLFNNPADLLAEHLERSRKAIRDPRVTVLDLHCGPMALAGSTRMQATTSEQLVAGAALETIFNRIQGLPELEYAEAFAYILKSLEQNQEVLADYLRFEAETYSKQGKITYFADQFMLDIFTDTTERSPTFMLPPFRKVDDAISPVPWAFVKNPNDDTVQAWHNALNRGLRCLEWTPDDYRELGAPDIIIQDPPRIRGSELLKFAIGREPSPERFGAPQDAAVRIFLKDVPEIYQTADAIHPHYRQVRSLLVGRYSGTALDHAFHVDMDLRSSSLELMSHMAIKLILNTISTGVMVVLGRVTGNWMSWVSCSNKKLIDRGIRLLMEIKGLDYRQGCEAIFSAMDELSKIDFGSEDEPSPVQYAMKKLEEKD